MAIFRNFMIWAEFKINKNGVEPLLVRLIKSFYWVLLKNKLVKFGRLIAKIKMQ